MASELTPKQYQAIIALLGHTSIIASAKAVGVDERTIRTWLDDPVFKAKLTEAESQVLDQAVRTLVSLVGKAAQVLEAALAEDYSMSVRLKAVNIVFTQMFHLVDLRNFDARLAEIERLQNHEQAQQASISHRSISWQADRTSARSNDGDFDDSE